MGQGTVHLEAVTPTIHYPPPFKSPASITYRHQGAHEDAHC